MSPGSFRTRRHQATPKLTCARSSESMLSRSFHFIPLGRFSLKKKKSLFPFNFSSEFAYLSQTIPLVLIAPQTFPLSVSPLFHPNRRLSVSPLHSYTPLFRSLRKSRSLIWDMLDLVSLKATLLTPPSASPQNSEAYLKQFHRSPGFVRWNAAHRGETSHSLC